MEQFLLTFWATSHVWALLSSSQPLLLVVFGSILLMSSVAARGGSGEADSAPEIRESNRGKQVVRPSSFSRASGPRTSGAVPESVRDLAQNAAARKQARADEMFHHV